MDPHEASLTMQVLADENLLATIMENVDNVQTLFNLVIGLPTAKVVFERWPSWLLMAALSGLPFELQQLAILYVALIQDHVTRASMLPILNGYLRPDNGPSWEPPPAYTALTISTSLSAPFETLRKIAVVFSAVEDLANGYVDCSIQFIEICNTAGHEIMRRGRDRNFRPLSQLWNSQYRWGGWYDDGEGDNKPQPWSLPLRPSEIYRVKRAFWRFEIFAALSHEPHTFPNEKIVGSGTAQTYSADALERWDIPQNQDEGARMFLFSLPGWELVEFESIYDYLWRETVGKVYKDKLDTHMVRYDEKVQQDSAEREAGTTGKDKEHWAHHLWRKTVGKVHKGKLGTRMARDGNVQQALGERKAGTIGHDIERWAQEQASFQAQFAREQEYDKASKDQDRYLTYCMSLGLLFLHRVHQQITRDGGEIITENYPPLRYRSLLTLQDTCICMDASRRTNMLHSYYFGLQARDAVGPRINGRTAPPHAPEDSPGAYGPNDSLRWLASRDDRDEFRINELWRAGWFMWEKK